MLCTVIWSVVPLGEQVARADEFPPGAGASAAVAVPPPVDVSAAQTPANRPPTSRIDTIPHSAGVLWGRAQIRARDRTITGMPPTRARVTGDFEINPSIDALG